ncbi:MAG: carboxypeptidase regulatory-like domain-containing protein [Aeromicrobium sp.]
MAWKSRQWLGWVLTGICVVSLLSVTSAQATATGTITGTVTDHEGEFMGEADVTLYEYDDTSAKWLPTTSRTTSIDDGTYAFEVPEGTYRVGFVGLPHMPEFAHDAPDVESADDIVVGADETEVVDAQLGLGGIITGTVTDEAGAGIEGDLNLFTLTGDGWKGLRSYESGESGGFWISGLPTGTYRLKAVNRSENGQYVEEFFDDARSLKNAEDIEVTVDQTTSGVDFELALRGQITGAVRNQAGDPLKNIKVDLLKLKNEKWVSVLSSSTGPDGTYNLNAPLRGTYRVGFRHPDYINEFFDDVTKVRDADDISVRNAEVTEGIDATLIEGIDP